MRVSAPLPVTALARAYDLQCPRYLVWMTDGVDRPRVRWEQTPAGRVLSGMGEAHERLALARLAPGEWCTPLYPPGDLEAGAHATAQLLREGCPSVVQGVLAGRLFGALPVRGMADLLVRTPRGYRVVEIKASLQVKTSQMLQAVAYTQLLAEMVPTDPPVLVDGSLREVEIPCEALGGLLREFVTETLPQWQLEGEGVFHRGGHCGSCPFDPHCAQDARRRKHVSLVAGVSPALACRLRACGVTDTDGLLSLAPHHARILGLDASALHRLQGQARALAEGRILPTGDPCRPPRVAVELFVEVESDPSGILPSRVGVLKRDTTLGLTAYRGAVIPPGEEADSLRWFLDLLVHQAAKAQRRGQDWAVVTYGSGALRTLCDVVSWLGHAEEEIDEILSHATDVLALIRRGWFLPVEQYCLESVLKVLGLPCPPEEVPCAALHALWRRTGEADLKRRLLAQGEATARAIMALWDWALLHG